MLKLIKFFSFLLVLIFFYDVGKIVFTKKTLKTAIDLRRRLNPVIKIRLPPPCELDSGIILILSILTLFAVSVLFSLRFFEIFQVQEKLNEFFFALNLPPLNSNDDEKPEKFKKVDIIEHLDQVPQKEPLHDSVIPTEHLDQIENKIYDPIINEIKEIECSRQCKKVEKVTPDTKDRFLGDIDRFEERLEAVELTLKSTENVTKQWGERIDQAENELISLHSQMYTILSKTQLNSAILDKSEESFLKNVDVPDVITDIKQTFEEVLKSTLNGSGDHKGNLGLFENNFNEIDWKDDLKRDVKKQIEEVQNKCSLLRNLAFSETEKLQTESIYDIISKVEHF